MRDNQESWRLKSPVSLSICISFLGIVLLESMAPVLAGTLSQFKQDVRDNFSKGCSKERPVSPESERFCTCFATSFVERYADDTLDKILKTSSKAGQDGASIVGLMLEPEALNCTQNQMLP